MKSKQPRRRSELPPQWRVEFGEYVRALDWDKTGKLALVGLANGRMTGVMASDGRSAFDVLAHDGGIKQVAIAPTGDLFCTCGEDSVAKLWSMDGKLVRELEGYDSRWVEAVAWAPSGRLLSVAAGRRVRVWSNHGEPLTESEALPSTVTGLAWSGDENVVAAACYGGVYLLPTLAGATMRLLPWKGSLISIAWSPDGKVIACATQESTVHFWRVASGDDAQMSGYRFKPQSLAWDRDSKLLATSGDDTITVWDFSGRGPEGTQPLQLRGHQALCTRVTFSPDRCVLATAGEDHSVLLWEPRKTRSPIRYAFLEDAVTAIAWNLAGTHLLAADAAGYVACMEVPKSLHR
jgi:WD40 repeat protein